MREPAGIRILVWMCVLIAVNQLGFGSIVPVLALYARSFDVTQSAIGARHRDLRARPLPRRGPRGPARRPIRAGATALAIGGVLSALGNVLCALAPTYPAFVGARFVAGAGAALVLATGLIVIADISTPCQSRPHDGGLPGRVHLRGRHRAAARRLLAEHWGLAAPFLAYAVASLVASAVAWLAIPETRAVRPADEPEPATTCRTRAQLRLLTAHRASCWSAASPS